MVGEALEQGFQPYLAPSRKNMSIISCRSESVAMGMGRRRRIRGAEAVITSGGSIRVDGQRGAQLIGFDIGMPYRLSEDCGASRWAVGIRDLKGGSDVTERGSGGACGVRSFGMNMN